MRLSFILSEIAKRENLKVEETDFEAKYQSIAQRINRPVDEVKAHYKGEEDRSDALELQILSEKVVQWIKDKAVIEELTEAKKGGK